MRICLILEGSYPYRHGGVSVWMHNYIKQMPEHEFVLWTVNAHAQDKGKFVFQLPENVVEVHEVFLDDALKKQGRANRTVTLSEDERKALLAIADCASPDWETIFRLFQSGKTTPEDLLMSESFLQILDELCMDKYPDVPFTDTFYTTRSMLLPVFHICAQDIPEADLYHSICTGYAGILGTMAQVLKKRPLILTEHGIYSREREEEMIRAQWTQEAFKKHWIRFFYMLSDAVYHHAQYITNLFTRNAKIQEDLGAVPERIRTIHNGIDYKRFSAIPLKQQDGFTDIGALVRIASIKDIKTLLYAFYELSSRMQNVRLHIMGGVEDASYAEECYKLKDVLHLDNVIFTGQIDVAAYMEKLDFTVLSSISEGQPLSVLESLAARRPCVATDVGCCRELLMGDGDDGFGQAGFIVPPMQRMALAEALAQMALDRNNMLLFGENGQRRVCAFYQNTTMIGEYNRLYQEAAEKWPVSDLN